MSDMLVVFIRILIGAGLVFGLCRIWFGPLKLSLDKAEAVDKEEFQSFQTALNTVSHVVREGHDDRCCSGVEDIWHAVLRFTAADRFFFPEKMLCDAETAFYKGLRVIDVVHPEVSEQTGQIRRFMERFYFA